MILLLDVGNTRVKWALADGWVLSCHGATQGYADDELDQLMRRARHAVVTKIAISHVAGVGLAERISQRARAMKLPEPVFFSVASSVRAVTAAYPQVGIDRVLGLVGARQIESGEAIVVDAGTAVTVDAVDATGQHLGGAVLPGRQLMCRALLAGTHGVNECSGKARLVFGRSTADGVSAGCFLAWVNGIKASLTEMLTTMRSAPIYVTGGDGPVVSDELDAAGMAHRFEPTLVLTGLLAESRATERQCVF